jgi:hypothetical protein
MCEVKNDNLLWVVKCFNKWIFILLPCEAKPWILWTLHLTADKKCVMYGIRYSRCLKQRMSGPAAGEAGTGATSRSGLPFS